MRNASLALITYLNDLGPRVQPYIADLLTIIQVDGTITRITSAGTNILSTSQAISPTDPTIYTFVSGGVTFTRGQTKIVIGFEVDDLSLTLMTDPSRDLLGGVPWPAAARQGALDQARIVLERVFMPEWGDTSYGTIIMFSGVAGPMQSTRSQVAITVQSNINVLGNPMPRNQYQPGCIHTLYDVGCTLLQATFTVAGTVGATNTVTAVQSNLVQASAYFDQGVITFTTGPCAGLSRTVSSYSSVLGTCTLTPPLPVAPVAGNSFTIYPGCDKKQGTCSAKFSNLTHFRGYPYVPVPESAG